MMSAKETSLHRTRDNHCVYSAFLCRKTLEFHVDSAVTSGAGTSVEGGQYLFRLETKEVWPQRVKLPSSCI